MKFSKEIWSKNGNTYSFDKRRIMMVDDIIDSYLRKRPKYSDVIDLLGVPYTINIVTSEISYITFINYEGCGMVNKSDMKLLEIIFDEDSLASDAYIREYDILKKSYILGKK